MNDNPLLDLAGVAPRFTDIEPDHVEVAVRQRIGELEDLAEALLSGGARTWRGLVMPLEEAGEALDRAWEPVEHLQMVRNDGSLREVHEATRPLVDEHRARLHQDPRLLEALTAVEQQADQEGLDAGQRKALELMIRDLRLAGAALSPEDRARFLELQIEARALQSRFRENTIEYAREARLVVEREADVQGLPESLVNRAREQALEDDPNASVQRWSFTTTYSTSVPFLRSQPNRELREALYRLKCTACTEGETDNTPLIDRLLVIRQEQAALLGYENYAELALSTRMAASPARARELLSDLRERARPHAEQDLEAITEVARERDGLSELQPWDVTYYAEILRQERYSFSEDEVRAYLPFERALSGWCELVRRLYEVDVDDQSQDGVVQVCHPTVRTLRVSEGGETLGWILLDPYAREGKKDGAWVGTCVDRLRRLDGRLQPPVANLVCNFAPPVGESPALLSHRNLQTLFHEGGHALHRVLSAVDDRACTGTRRVPRDGVELPSQMHENWIWEPSCLAFVSGHTDGRGPIPDELLASMLAARNFRSGMLIQRQIAFALFDLDLHERFDPAGEQSVHDLLVQVQVETTVLPPPAWNRFENAFHHLFGSDHTGYASGYYGYIWANVLAADAFSRFSEEGVLSSKVGRDFRRHVLERGGAADPMELFVAFRGREPTPDALLRQLGLS